MNSYTEDSDAENFINSEIIFGCKNNAFGCKYTTKDVSEISFHLIDCDSISKNCPNNGCFFSGNDVELNNHLVECNFTDLKCGICFRRLEKTTLDSHNCMIHIVE